MRISLYIHIPFCLQKCLYCDFASSADATVGHEEYATAVIREMELRARALPGQVEATTLYFGGGTPSLLAPQLISNLIDAAARLFSLTSEAEIALEANPGTVTGEKLAGYGLAGVNRLSLGVQSFDDRMLALLGRIHTAQQAREAVTLARESGFSNLGIDLIHSLPGQSVKEWEGVLRQAAALQPDHVSAYGLSVEEGTPFHALMERGEVMLPDQETAAEMICATMDLLASHGYEQYEIANFAKPGRRSRHNQVYWRRGSYLGFGAAAHSFLREPEFGRRWHNPVDLSDYFSRVTLGELPAQDEMMLSRREAMEETLFLGLRLLEGVSTEAFEREFSEPISGVFPGVIEKYLSNGLLAESNGNVCLTRKGLLLANQVFTDFV